MGVQDGRIAMALEEPPGVIETLEFLLPQRVVRWSPSNRPGFQLDVPIKPRASV